MADYSREEQTFHPTLEGAATEMRNKTAEFILRVLAGSLDSPPYCGKQISEVEEFLRRNEKSAKTPIHCNREPRTLSEPIIFSQAILSFGNRSTTSM